MVLTSDSGVAKMVRSLRVHGSGQEQYIYALRGKNSRLDELQAAILRVKYRHLDEWVAARRENARRYSSLLQEAGVPVQPPKEASYAVHAFGVYTVRAEQRDELEQHLKSRGIGCRVYYPIALHLQKAYRELGYHEGMFPVAERACREVLSLPIYPELSEEMLQYVVREIAWFYCA